LQTTAIMGFMKTVKLANSGEHLPIEAPVAFCRALEEFRATL
jgi:hypothetical protein